MKLINKKYLMLACGVGLALLSGAAVSRSFVVHNGPAEEGRGFENNFSYISLDGKVTIDPPALLQASIDALGAPPEMPTDFSLISLRINPIYFAPSGDEYPIDIEMSAATPRYHSEEFAKGHYRRIDMIYTWPKVGNEISQWVTYTNPRIIVANNHKIPVYMYAEALNEPFFAPIGSPSDRYHDFHRLRSLFRVKHENDVGALATNANANIDNNYGCSGWYQFRFFGYLDYDWLENGISRPGDMQKLPPGITLVPSITRCGDDENTFDGFPACATLNGTRIALTASNFTNPDVPEAVVTLHEIGHTKGLKHAEMDNDNIMTSPSRSDTNEILREQCPNFSIGKQYVSPDPWEE